MTRSPIVGVDDAIIEWLMKGDAAIRWQTLRDLRDAPAVMWQAERGKVAGEGWGARLLARQDEDGGWGGGVYSPKWISATYTLLLLRDLGLPPAAAAARRGARALLDRQLGPEGSARFEDRLLRCDLCIVGMTLSIGACFGVADGRLPVLAHHLLEHQMNDGGWNCDCKKRGRDLHGSFHTTFNVLEGLRDYLDHGAVPDRQAIEEAQGRATEFMLAHRLFRSHRTGQIVHRSLLMLSYPPRWYYDILRGLDFFRRVKAPVDPRFQEALDVLVDKRRRDGTWPAQNRHPGKVFFEMEATGRPSRWNTLRALRVLRWAGRLTPTGEG